MSQSNHHHCQPFAVPNRGTAIPTGELSSVFGDRIDSSSFTTFIPAFDFVPSVARYGEQCSEGERQGVVKE
jgi:hypothetical protein